MKPVYKGNVHEVYDISDGKLVIVSTDRISALGHILPVLIPNKGVILNQISNYWFNMTKDIVDNHIIDDRIENMPSFFHNDLFRDRTILVEKLDIIPYEFIIRGYIFGRLWEAFDRGEDLCGYMPSKCYQLAEKLDYPIITPTTKYDRKRDDNVKIEDIINTLGSELAEQIFDICFKLYDLCSKYSFAKGFILADTKLEFGLNKDKKLILADEIFTPDSSRFWDAEDYTVGISPKSYDKQLIREWLKNNKLDGEFQFGKIPQSIINGTAQRYNIFRQKIMS